MRSKKFTLLTGAIIIALVVSVLPMGIFANAAKEETRVTQERRVKLLTIVEAEEIAIKSVLAESVKKDEIKVTDAIDDTKIGKLQYYFKIESKTHVYFIEVHARTGKVLRFVEILREEVDEKKPATTDKGKDEKTDKKDAIAEFQKEMKAANNKKLENKDDFHKDKDYYKKLKKDAIEDFKEAKDKVKDKKKELKQEKKEEEKKLNKKDEKPINKIKYLTEKEIEEIALKKFNNKNIKPGDIEIELIKDNPPVYIVETYNKVNKTKYELVIHATTGIILEYEKALD